MEALGQGIVNGLWAGLTSFTFGFIPTWVWLVVGVIALAIAYKQLGWQGLLGLALLLLTFGAYRQGWRDSAAGRKPIVPVEKQWPEHVPPAKPKRKTLQSVFQDLVDRGD